jgi:hypothetical protein
VRSLPQNSFGLNKTLVLFAMAIVLMICAAVIATMPSSGTVEAHESTFKTPPCRTEEVPLDEGYGVSRVVVRRVCEDL